MKRLLQISIYLICCNLAFGQVEKESFWKPYIVSNIQKLGLISFDSLNYEQAYRIWNLHQVVELIKINDTTYNGQLLNFVTKITRNNKKIRIISQS